MNTVDNAIREAIKRFGIEAVKEAASRLTKRRRGRRIVNDLRELRSVREADAREWLEGGDPFASRSNYAIAKQFAEANPGQSAESTRKRIEQKLVKKPHDRRWRMLVTAEGLSRDAYPWTQHIRALEALSDDWGDHWESSLKWAKTAVADYEAKRGEVPADTLTMEDVEDVDGNREVVRRDAANQLMLKDATGGVLAAHEAKLTKEETR